MRTTLTLLLVLAAALAGCGSDDGDGGNGDGGEATGERLEITAVDVAFEPASLEAGEGGEVTIVLTNEGDLPHAFALEDGESTDTLDGGESAELSLDLEPGSYVFYCPVGNHREQGMEGTLVVGGEAAGAPSRPADDAGYGYE